MLFRSFEGAGAVSRWRIEIPSEFRQFDYDTISDIVLHLKYTAREGGGALKEKASQAVKKLLAEFKPLAGDDGKPLMRLFSARHEFPAPWHRLLHPDAASGENILELEITRERFPFFTQDETVQIQVGSIAILAAYNSAVEYKVQLTPPLPVEDPLGISDPLNNNNQNLFTLSTSGNYGDLHEDIKDVSQQTIALTDPEDREKTTWKLKMRKSSNHQDFKSLEEGEVKDIFVILGYELVAAAPPI